MKATLLVVVGVPCTADARARQDASVSGHPPPLLPDAGERGLAGADPAWVADLVDAAWVAAAELVRTVRLDGPSRQPGLTSREVLVPLGSWDEHERFTAVLDDARHDRVHEVDDAAGRAALLAAAHHDADTGDLAAAFDRARTTATAFLRSPDAARIGREPTASTLGQLLVTGVLVAATYDLAVHVLDVAEPDAVPPALYDAALGGLADVTGALAARRGLDVSFLLRTPHVAWATAASAAGDWTTVRLEVAAAQTGWPTVEGTAADILDVSAGRRAPVPMLLARRLRLRDVPGLLAVLPALDVVSDLPGGAALQAAARTLSRTGRALSRLGVLAGR
jgi:hypothetical protein